jgi:hypothetical protein
LVHLPFHGVALADPAKGRFLVERPFYLDQYTIPRDASPELRADP